MNKKYIKYIDFIVSDIQAPYFTNMKDNYGLKQYEYKLVLSKVYNQPVTIEDDYVYDEQGNRIYYENSDGGWSKKEYDDQGNKIYYEDNNGYIEDNRYE